MTSGTSSEPLVLVFESAYTAQWVNQNSERFLLHHGLMNLRLGNVLQVRNSDMHNARVLALDPGEVTEDVCALVADFAPDRGYSFPTLMMQSGSLFDEKTRRGIEQISFSGERWTDAHVRYFTEWFPNTRTIPIYIASDTGALSGPDCGHLPYNHYHPKDTVTIAIEDVDADGVGDVYITTRLTEHTRIERYHNGDAARWVTTACACGNTKTFEVLGRKGYDYIKLGRTLLRQEEFDRVAALCHDLFDDYRLEAAIVAGTSGASLGKIKLLLYKAQGSGGADDTTKVAARISSEVFLSYSKTLGNFVQEGVLLPLEIEWVREPFPKGIKNVKLKQLYS